MFLLFKSYSHLAGGISKQRNILSPCLRGTRCCMQHRRGLNRWGSARPYILRQSLTLLLLSYIRFVVFLSQLFDRKKLQKLPAHGFRKSLTPLLGNSANIPRSSLSWHLCLPFQSREQKNSLHALPSSYGTHAQTLLFLFLYWNWHALLLKRCRFCFDITIYPRISTSIGNF